MRGPAELHEGVVEAARAAVERVDDEAAHLFRSAAKLQPFDADALFNLGGSHDIMERPQESLWAYRGALERERKNEARIQNNIGHQLGKLNRWRESMHAFREAEEADPDFPETHYNLARCEPLQRFLTEDMEQVILSADEQYARSLEVEPRGQPGGGGAPPVDRQKSQGRSSLVSASAELSTKNLWNKASEGAKRGSQMLLGAALNTNL